MSGLEGAIGPACECIIATGLPAVVAREASAFFCLEENWQSLEEAVRKLRAVSKSVTIMVTEGTNKFNESETMVNVWLEEVGIVLGLHVALAEEYKKLEGCSFLCICTPDFCHRYLLGKQIIKMLKKISMLLEEATTFYEIFYTPWPPTPPPPPPPLSLEPTLKKLHNYLNDESRSIIGIWGQGGVSKTTLLNAFNNDLKHNRGRFHVVIKIAISNSVTLDIVGIQRAITERLGLPWVDTDETTRAKSLVRALAGKKFVILLDDVRREFELEDVGIPIPDDGSKIILASRDQNVCN